MKLNRMGCRNNTHKSAAKSLEPGGGEKSASCGGERKIEWKPGGGHPNVFKGEAGGRGVNEMGRYPTPYTSESVINHTSVGARSSSQNTREPQPFLSSQLFHLHEHITWQFAPERCPWIPSTHQTKCKLCLISGSPFSTTHCPKQEPDGCRCGVPI